METEMITCTSGIGLPGDDGALILGQYQGGAAPGVLLSHRG